MVKKPEEAWTLLLKVAAIVFLFVLTPTVIYLNFYQKTTDLPPEIALTEKTVVSTSEPEKVEQGEISLPPAENKKGEKPSLPAVKDVKQKQPAGNNEKAGIQPATPSKEKSALADIAVDDREIAESVPDLASDETVEPDISAISGAQSLSSSAGSAAKMSRKASSEQLQRSATKYVSSPNSSIEKDQAFENEKFRLFLNPVFESAEKYPDSLTYQSLKRDNKINIYLDVTAALKDLEVIDIKQVNDSTIEILFSSQVSYLLDPNKKEGKAFRKK